MGCCHSNEIYEEKSRSKEIDNQLRGEKLKTRNEVKLLLLGAGESGKSTILKQMKLIHDGGYSRDERDAFKEIIFSNTIQSMREVLEIMEDIGTPLANPHNKKEAAIILNIPEQTGLDHLPIELVTAIRNLWKDKNLSNVLRDHEYQMNDSAKYYFDSIDRIGDSNYVPTDQDLLRSRVKTTGITETTFVIGNLTYRMFDVGGQRSERKKWIHCFENVTAIIFLVAISEYNQVLIEDETVNRMQEALTLFDSICNSRWFIKTSIILFLNKIDIFKEKIEYYPLKDSFEDFDGPNIYHATSDYILHRFLSLNQSESKQVYTHLTCATDTEQIKFVMSAVNDIIIQNNLRDVGML